MTAAPLAIRAGVQRESSAAAVAAAQRPQQLQQHARDAVGSGPQRAQALPAARQDSVVDAEAVQEVAQGR